MRFRTLLAPIVVIWAFLASAAIAAGGDAMSLRWEDLLPEGEEARLEQIYKEFYEGLEAQTPGGLASIMEGGALDEARQLGTFNTVDDLDGELVRIPGFVVPLDFNAVDVYGDFLLVPYFGACIHAPPPPPNQIVYVRVEKPVRLGQIWDPFFIEGVLRTEKAMNELGNAAYTMEFERFDPFR